MVSLRFPFSFSQPAPSHTPTNIRPFNVASAAFTVAAAGAAAAAAGLAASSLKDPTNPKHPFLQNAIDFFFSNHSLPLWASLSLADSSNSIVDSRTGVSFPSLLANSRRLLGIGIRRKSVLGLKNIDVYAFGITSTSFFSFFSEYIFIYIYIIFKVTFGFSQFCYQGSLHC